MGLFGGSDPAPIISTPIAPVEGPKTNTLDPNHGEGVEAARRKRLALSSRSSRSNLRIKLATTDEAPQRAGIAIS